MSGDPTDRNPETEPGHRSARDRIVYVMPESTASSDGEVSLRDLWAVIWGRKWTIVAVSAIFAIISVTYALLATEWYRAEALLAPADEVSSPALGGQLSGLAALAGVNIGGDNMVEAVATLKSREFARDFIEEHNLLPVFFADEWEAERNGWSSDDPEDWPDVRDAVKYFHDEVLHVTEHRQSGLITLGVHWTDPDVASAWAHDLVRRVNATLRERALQEAARNVAYLQAELAKTSMVPLQQSIGRLLESELEKLMIARGSEEYAFRVIDEAATLKQRVWPKRSLIAVLGTALGAMLAMFGVLLAHGARTESGSR